MLSNPMKTFLIAAAIAGTVGCSPSATAESKPAKVIDTSDYIHSLDEVSNETGKIKTAILVALRTTSEAGLNDPRTIKVGSERACLAQAFAPTTLWYTEASVTCLGQKGELISAYSCNSADRNSENEDPAFCRKLYPR